MDSNFEERKWKILLLPRGLGCEPNDRSNLESTEAVDEPFRELMVAVAKDRGPVQRQSVGETLKM
jgi:hypothetical protein